MQLDKFVFVLVRLDFIRFYADPMFTWIRAQIQLSTDHWIISNKFGLLHNSICGLSSTSVVFTSRIIQNCQGIIF